MKFNKHRRQQADNPLWFVCNSVGCEMMHARFESHSFPPHSHSTYVIEIVESGVDEFLCGGKLFRAKASDIVVIAPGTVHSGRPSGSRPLHYRSFYPRPEFFDAIAATVFSPPQLVTFRSPLIRDQDIADNLSALHRALQSNRSCNRLAMEFREQICKLVERHATTERIRNDSSISGCAPLECALKFLRERATEHAPLHQLAKMCDMSPFHFLRRFKHATGLPPRQYQLNRRIERGREYLDQGLSICAAALRSGFADQSHFSRYFLRVYGITPGSYVAARSFKTQN